MPDALVLAVAVAVAYGPGLALLNALPMRPGLVQVALAPAASVTVAGPCDVGRLQGVHDHVVFLGRGRQRPHPGEP